ncbi:thiamine diphosphokinase [Pseudopelagicola sp. nBUS_20]|uniref:thiamine diphosphokinase n=1 Tax=Pseudopelagicola sp. nBUS_20 TaxID=3395317 RepID=UPI003EB723B3
MTGTVYDLEPITLVGAGQVNEHDITRCLDMAPRLVASDGGASHCVALNLIPEAVIGDMDSVDLDVLAAVPAERVHKIEDQDTTDFQKALHLISAPYILGVGFSGGRLDHQLACFNSLVRNSEKRCVLLGDTDIVFLAPPSLRLPLDQGTRVSMFPMGEVEAKSDGLKWPVDGLMFAPDGQIGTSNEATGVVHLQMSTPKMLLILSRCWLETVVKALTIERRTWATT